MDYELLLSNFRNYVPITEDEWQIACSLITEKAFKKGQFINKEGEVNRFTHFIESGLSAVFAQRLPLR